MNQVEIRFESGIKPAVKILWADAVTAMMKSSREILMYRGCV
jgi:hypothetical protein